MLGIDSRDTGIGDIPLKAVQPPRFDLTTEENRLEMTEYLDKHGYAVIAAVVPTHEDILQIRALFWDYMEARTTINRNDVSTWRNGAWLPDELYGLMNHGQFPQSEYMWKLRMLPKVKLAFQTIWNGNDDLLVSFDGGNAFRPWKYDPTWKTEGGWWHVDQGVQKKGRKVCIQGLINLYDANEYSGGLCVIPGSHLLHEHLCDVVENIPALHDFLRIPPEEDSLLRSADAILVACKAGDLIVWDSRTIHCNSPAIAVSSEEENKEERVNWDLIRLVGYICMTPAELASEKTIESRREVFIRSGSTNHWPHECHIIGLAPKKVPDKKLQDLSQSQRELIVGKKKALEFQ